MVFQDAPAAFDRIVFAMVRRIVRQADGHLIVLHKLHDALHELGAPTVILGAIIEIDHQRGDVREPAAHALPPLAQSIHQTVTGHFGGDPIHKQLIQGGQENAHGGHCRFRLKIVVRSLHRDPTLAAAREGANFDGGFRIHRDP